MSCLGDDEVTGLLTGALAGDAFASAETHLDVCRRCRLLVSTLAAKTGDAFRGGSLSAFGPGDTVAGRYRIVALLGTGGMGEVYAALDTVLGEQVALKTLAAGIALDQVGVARFKAEVQVARRVTHRNVCRVFDVGFHVDGRPAGVEMSSPGLPFFTMELLPGETLRRSLRSAGPLSCVEVLPLLEQIAAGLDAAHAAGVVHRDLKSENVMLVPEDGGIRVVITDFGLAHQLDQQAFGRAPLVEHAAGTLAYMAPEQLVGEQPRPATDIYALGVVLFELLTGELPFTPAEIVAGKGQARRKPPRSLRSFCAAAPAAWEAAIERCLQVLPAARFASAGEVLAALSAQPAAPDRRRALTRLSVVTALTALVFGASFAAARRVPGPPGVTPAPNVEASLGSRSLPPSPSRSAPPAEAKRSAKPSNGPLATEASAEALPVAGRSPSAARRWSSRGPRPGSAPRASSKPIPVVAPRAPIGADDFVDPFELR